MKEREPLFDEGELREYLYKLGGSMRGEAVAPIRRMEAKIGRNNMCPCGSGKKYKKCCMEK